MTSEQARDAAHQILNEPRFHPDHGGGGGILHPIGDALDQLGEWIADILPSGSFSFDPLWLIWLAIALALVAIAVHLARRAIGTKVKLSAADARRGGRGAADPRELERAADRAEQEGDAGLALRLRFEAGLLRLAAADAIRLRPSLTVRGAVRQVRSRPLEDLARRFEEVVYGGREATLEEAAEARETWREILATAGRT